MKLKNTAVALSVAGLGLLATSTNAQAATFTVPGFGAYNITTVVTSYNSAITQLQSQPWFGSQSAAVTFANAVGTSLGTPNPANPNSGVDGPIFAYAVQSSSIINVAEYNSGTPGVITRLRGRTDPFTFAIASRVPEPSEVLGTLFFGAIGAGYVIQRQSRNKVA